MNSVLVVNQPAGQLVATPAAGADALVASVAVAQLVIDDPSTGVQTLVATESVASLSVAPSGTPSTLVATQPVGQLLVGVEALQILEALGGGGPAIPPGVNFGGHGPVRLAINQTATGGTLNGSIRIIGKRINVPVLGRIDFTQGAVETPLITGGLSGTYWLLVGEDDASVRFSGWAGPSDGPFFLASHDPVTDTWKAIDSSLHLYTFVLEDTDDVLARIERKDPTSVGIEKCRRFFNYTPGLAPDYLPSLTPPSLLALTAEGRTKIGVKDGAARQRLYVASSARRTDADLFVRWRDAAGDYPGCVLALDFVAEAYQSDAGQPDSETLWTVDKRPLKGSDPRGLFGNFDADEALDVAVQWRESDDAGLVSDWTMVSGVEMPGDTTPPGPVIVAMAGPLLAGVTARATDLVFNATAPADKDYAGAQLWLGQTPDPADAVLIAFVPGKRNHKIHYVYKSDLVGGLVEGVTYHGWLASVDESDNVGDLTYLGSDDFRLVGSLDLGQNSVDLGYHATGLQRAGQLASVSSGSIQPTGLEVIVTTCSDGDHVDFGRDLNVPPRVVFIVDGLPALPAGNAPIKRADNLTSTGFDAYLKQTAPTTYVIVSPGPGSVDASVPKPIGQTGLSLVRGSADAAYNTNYRLRLNTSFTVIDGGQTGSAVVRLYRYDGTAWHKLTDLTFVAGGMDAWTGTLTVPFNFTGTLNPTDKVGVNIAALGENTATAVINAFTALIWKTRTEPSPTSLTPNGEDVEVLIFPVNVAS